MAMNDGGLAFPRQTEKGMNGDVLVYSQPGMSLRAWLAGQWLAGQSQFAGSFVGNDDAQLFAQEAVLVADALIAELDK